jgi:hypothetical protein
MRFPVRSSLGLWLLAGCGAASADSCEKLARLNLRGTTITTAELVPAGNFKSADGPAQQDLPAFCRVGGVIKPTPDSDIRFEVWMPASGWNRRFLGIGNPGFGGAISYNELGAAVSRGYAAASTDTGHRAGVLDAGWALNHPEKVIDFGYRAIHETTQAAKAILAALFGAGPAHSYFNGCSNAGRQALMEAQRYPEDYDGIAAGAAANNWTRLLTMGAADLKALHGNAAAYIPAAKLPAIDAAALAACDAKDGLKDGIIANPSECNFDPAALLCKASETDQCLTGAQVAALKALYGGLRDRAGAVLFPGYSPGGEAGPGGWAAWITGGAPGTSLMSMYVNQFFRNMVYDDPTWDYKVASVDQMMKLADQRQAVHLNATDPDLKRFRERGGKLILYHGWSDPAVPPLNTISYYEAVMATTGLKQGALFLRLYMVPGMQHCGGGSGPNMFGQSGVPQSDAKHDIGAALERWTENGVAPDEIIATNSNAPGGKTLTRPLCPYPHVAKYKGSGGIDDAANFTCGN